MFTHCSIPITRLGVMANVLESERALEKKGGKVHLRLSKMNNIEVYQNKDESCVW